MMGNFYREALIDQAVENIGVLKLARMFNIHPDGETYDVETAMRKSSIGLRIVSQECRRLCYGSL